MQWFGRRESDNVDDLGSGGGGGGRLLFGGGLGATIIGIIIYLLGGNPSQLLQQQAPQDASQTTPSNGPEDSTKMFIRVVLADTEDVWGKIFTDMGRTYQKPRLELFSGQTQSGCGGASSATGPFYCPTDGKVYLDRSFFQELQDRFHVPGNFPWAYVIAHEVGHHVQDLLGTTAQFEQMRSQASEKEANRLSVKLELQADFYAGVWAHYEQSMKGVLNAEDIKDALDAASAIGDDRLQKQAQGYVVPDAFTHGTSAQRMYWFKKGYDTGDLSQGDTFKEVASL